jgi:hypothetical protein
VFIFFSIKAKHNLISFSSEQVGDFGLSRLKHETYLATTTGKGTVSAGTNCFLLYYLYLCHLSNLSCIRLHGNSLLTCILLLFLFFFLKKKKHVLQPQWMAPEVLRNEPSDEKYVIIFKLGQH